MKPKDFIINFIEAQGIQNISIKKKKKLKREKNAQL
jgi:hypothetical protein